MPRESHERPEMLVADGHPFRFAAQRKKSQEVEVIDKGRKEPQGGLIIPFNF